MEDIKKSGLTPQEAKERFGAQYYLTMKDGITPQMYYKFISTGFNDGTRKDVLNYKSSFGVWMPSDRNSNLNPLENLIKIK